MSTYLSTQKASQADLLRVLLDVEGLGARILEHPAFGTVHPGQHDPRSFHRMPGGGAGDVNYGPAGAPQVERQFMTDVIPLFLHAGLGVIYARDGVHGSAARHRDHLHADVGSSVNLGARYESVRTPDWTAYERELARLRTNYLTTTNTTPEDDVATLLIKGDKAPDVYSLNTVTGRRRPIAKPEYDARRAHGEKLVTMAQASFDAIPKEAAR